MKVALNFDDYSAASTRAATPGVQGVPPHPECSLDCCAAPEGSMRPVSEHYQLVNFPLKPIGATRDDHSCKYALTTPSECKDPNAKNYAPDAYGISMLQMSMPNASRSAKSALAERAESGAAAARQFEVARVEAAEAGAAWAQAVRAVVKPTAARLVAIGECSYPVLGCTAAW